MITQLACHLLSLLSLTFLATGSYFWMTDYLVDALLVSQVTSSLATVLVSFTAPMLAVIVSGALIESAGGYQSRQLLDLSLCLAIIGCLVAIVVPYVDSLWIFVACMWTVYFLAGILVACLTGIMIVSLPSQSRGTACTVGWYSVWLFGCLPAPAIYGWLNLVGPTERSRLGMKVLMSSSLVAVVCLSIALCIIDSKIDKVIESGKMIELVGVEQMS